MRLEMCPENWTAAVPPPPIPPPPPPFSPLLLYDFANFQPFEPRVGWFINIYFPLRPFDGGAS